MGQIRGSQLALEHMRRDKGGRGGVIVNTVSMAGQNVPLFRDHYHLIIGTHLHYHRARRCCRRHLTSISSH